MVTITKTVFKSKNLFKFSRYFNTFANIEDSNIVYSTNLNLDGYKSKFLEIAKDSFTKLNDGDSLFDPNLSDQCCQIRACWSSNFFRKYNELKTVNEMNEDDLLKLGLGSVINRCSILQLNCLNRIDRWKNVEKEDLEKILNESLSNKKFEKLFVAIKSLFSRKVNKEIYNILKENSKLDILPDILTQLSGKYFFTQKHKRLPFIPIFSAGYILLELIQHLNLPVILVYSHYIVKDNYVYLNGVTKFQVRNNKLYETFDFNENTKCVTIESYSVNYIERSYPYNLKFYKYENFIDVINTMKFEFEFDKSILCSEALHDKYHQKPNILKNGVVADYEFDDLSKQYNDCYDYYKNLGKESGYGINHWNPSANIYLKNDIPFDMFHIYCTSIKNLNELLKKDQKVLKIRKNLSSIKPLTLKDNYDSLENIFYY